MKQTSKIKLDYFDSAVSRFEVQAKQFSTDESSPSWSKQIKSILASQNIKGKN